MTSNYEIEPMLAEELSHNFFSKDIGDSALTLSPALWYQVQDEGRRARRRVGPKEIAENTALRYDGWPAQIIDLFQILQVRTEAAVHAQDPVVYQGCHGQVIEQVDEGTPELRLVPPFALIPESIYLCYILALVIASQEMHLVRVLYLEGQKNAEGLYALLASVNVIAKKKVVGVRRSASIVHEPQEVVILSVNIGSDRERSTQSQKHGLLHDKCQCFLNQPLYVLHLEVN